jgi:hypothetical protein
MRTFIVSVAVVCGLVMIPAGHASGALAAGTPGVAVLSAQTPDAPPPQQPAQVNVQVQHSGRVWYASPVWIAIGAIALVVLIMLIVMASRGSGGTTVVRG